VFVLIRANFDVSVLSNCVCMYVCAWRCFVCVCVSMKVVCVCMDVHECVLSVVCDFCKYNIV
jgi:hypothetical protein